MSRTPTLFVLAGALLLVACHSASEGVTRPDQGETPRRVVALAPSLATIVADIGAGDRLVGISSYGRVPPGAEKAQRVGGFVDPSIERIIALQPDLIIGVPLQKRPLDSCRSAGLKVLEVDCQSLNDALEAYETLGRALKREEQARASRKNLQRGLDDIRAKVANREPPRTLFLLGQAGEDLQQVYPVAPGNFTHELLEIAGGVNVLETAAVSISTESVITLAPDVIIEVAMDDRGDQQEKRLPTSPMWSRLESVPAVQNGRVFSIASSALLQPGPRMVDGAALLYRLLHDSQSSSP